MTSRNHYPIYGHVLCNTDTPATTGAQCVHSASAFLSDLYDLYDERTDSESLHEGLQGDNNHDNKQNGARGYGSFQPSYEVIEPKQLSADLTRDSIRKSCSGICNRQRIFATNFQKSSLVPSQDQYNPSEKLATSVDGNDPSVSQSVPVLQSVISVCLAMMVLGLMTSVLPHCKMWSATLKYSTAAYAKLLGQISGVHRQNNRSPRFNEGISEERQVVERQAQSCVLNNISVVCCSLFGKEVTRIFVPEHFQAFIDGIISAQLTNSILRMSNCYYSGHVLDSDGSSVTLRICFGLRGIIEFLNESYIIEPLTSATGFLHVVYKIEANLEGSAFILDNDTDLKSRGYQHQLLKQFHQSTKIKSAIFSVKRYMKVAVYVTVEVYKSLGSSPTNTVTYLMQVFSYLNMKFHPFNMQVFLSAVNIWTVSNQCHVSESLSDTLDNFIVWLSELSFPSGSYDIPLLLVGGQHDEIGTTYFGKMCSQNNGAILTFPTGLLVEKYSGLVAHILGHNLGMLHDNSSTRECICPASSCIMDTSMMSTGNAKSFTSCSMQDFHTFITSGRANCLNTYPSIKSSMDLSLCGNRVLDIGESCDCGTEADCRNDPCCDYKTCTLKPGAVCAYGVCCLNCQFLAAGKLCRKAADECDLPEFCTEAMSTCPEDIYQQNGNPCNTDLGVCYKGKCKNANTQYSVSADLECYQELNVIGNRFGNCGGFKDFYARCLPDDVLCGKLHCAIKDGESVSIANAVVSYFATENQTCITADYLRNTDATDLLLVNDGTMCGKNKICTNKHKCHCDPGWKPPTCGMLADGGSFARNIEPDEIDDKCTTETFFHTKLLFIIFFGIFPITILIVLVLERIAMKCYWRYTSEPASDESLNNSGSREMEATNAV
ncbi:disintegrin and metalloproteinase domain-containing protein 2-like [Gastrophryne carolinensis]